MKKLAIAFYALAAFSFVTLFTQCKKEPVCDLVLHVHKTTTGIDTADALPHCLVNVGLEDNYADFAKAEGYTDQNGVFTHTFKYEALLDVMAVYDSTWVDTNDIQHRDYFVGTGRVKLEPGETVEQYILATEAQ
ncbi:MAG: hypothetical protein J6X65_08905 [Bacteroidales bacterium]|nr:hypothetical protein [Bacteroidales bacterium]